MNKIKNKLFLTAAAIGLTLSANAGIFDLPGAEKIYVSPENVQLNSSSIYVWDGYEWVHVDAIHSDEIGLYYETYAVNDPMIDHWDCPICDSYNFLEWTSCYNCGWPW